MVGNKYLANSADRKWFKTWIDSLVVKEAHTWTDISHAKAALLNSYLPKLVKERYSSRSSSFYRDKALDLANFKFWQFRKKSATNSQWDLVEAEVRSSLLELAFKLLDEALDDYQRVADSADPLDLKASVIDRWQPLTRRPSLPPRDLTPTEAEYFVCDYLLFLGAKGASVTKQTRDGGVDVESDNFIVQVKHQHSPVGVKVVREMLGLSVATAKQPVIFTKYGYSEEAYVFAYEQGVALFVYTPNFIGIPGLGESYSFNGMAQVLPLNPDRFRWSHYTKDLRTGPKITEHSNEFKFGKDGM